MVAVAVLAAGKGTRMKSKLPKVLHELGGVTLVERALRCAAGLEVERQLAIVGYQADLVRQALAHLDVTFVEQTEQLGTGHAVQQLLPPLAGYEGDVLILNGDVPLLRPETLAAMLAQHRETGADATLLTAQLPDPTGYGRVFCDEQFRISEIIEHRDCTAAQRQNRRGNAGIYCFRWSSLERVLPKLSNDNDQNEYYLTDAIAMLDAVYAIDVADYRETLGINDRKQLAEAYGILQERLRDHWMAAGVTLVDPDSVTIDDGVQLGQDVVIEPQTHLRGTTVIGDRCRIGPGTLVENSTIGADVTLQFSVVSDSQVADGSRVGPYAHLRGHAEIAAGCRIGNFVEIKKSQVGPGTNVAHLSYLGDAELGAKVNVGAGTITANYDGVNKHRTVIGAGSKTGANSVLVAPITVGQGVTIAAGSTITKDVPDHSLAIARARQMVREGWVGPQKA